jgi:ATP-binding cassette, subfamily B, bacterial
MKDNIQAICWPKSKLGDALSCLSQRVGLEPECAEVPVVPAWVANSDDDTADSLHSWLDSAACWMGVEAEPVETTYAEVDDFLRNCSPALIQLDFPNEQAFLAVVSSRGRTLQVLSPELNLRRVPTRDVTSVLCDAIEEPLRPEVNELLDRAGIPGCKRAAALAAILRERLGSVAIGNCWLLRMPPGKPFRQQLKEAHLMPRIALFIATHAVESLLMVVAWWMIGRAVLEGWLDYGWLLAWALVLVTRVPFRLIGSWTQGAIALTAGGLLKRRLLAGTLRVRPEEIRHEGAGAFLGRVIESEALESLAMGGGLAGLMAVVEAVIASIVLAFGAKSMLLGLLLPIWMLVLAVLAWRYIRQRGEWTEQRLAITRDLIERMTGHRTRLAQQAPAKRHEQEDESLADYLETSMRMDGALVRFVAIVPRGWLIVGIITLLPGFVSGNVSPTTLAVSLGGILLGQAALRALTEALAYFASAFIAWNKVKFLFDAAARQETHAAPDVGLAQQQEEPAPNTVLAEAEGIVFQHSGRPGSVLDACNLEIVEGDRILLEGPSGGGKSTLVAILAGLREPQAGLLMLRGLDRQTLGPTLWRRTVAAAPQFHENHILTGTLAFNLLMGRGWPPSPEDYEDAVALCRELGLGPLLDRMPAGLLQTVGETGWQLSHGERCRVFLARALLQRSDVVILDESFGALDPFSVKQAMECAHARAGTLLVVAHP